MIPDLEQPVSTRGQLAGPGTSTQHQSEMGASRFDDEIEVTWLLRALWRWWWLGATCTLAGGVLGFLIASRTPVLYEASVTLVLPKAATGGESPPTAPSVRTLVTQPSVVGDVLRSTKRDTTITPAAFVNRVVVDEIPNTNLLRLRIRDEDPIRAAQTAKLLADRAVVLSQRLGSETSASVGEQLKQQLEGAAARLNEAQQRLLDFQRRSQIELLRKDVETLLEQRREAPRLALEADGERALLKTVEEELAKRKRTLATSTASSKPLVTPGDSGRSLRQLEPDDGDAVYTALDRQVAASRARLAMLEQMRSKLNPVLSAPQLTPLNELYAREMQLARLETARDVTERVYTDLAARYEQVRADASGGGPRLHVLDPVISPGQPLPRGRLRKTALGLFAGLLVGLAAIAALGSKPARLRLA